ncbi:hypothetical protein SEUCBS139899_009251 [Sporothrix eucalyptigena]|uniref:6-phosphogluconolactonase n=1 Tax=Sporothrix eucalyptigena TaxID=1812306 RepID=A0ABP0CPW1_9PEZI
MPSNYVFVGSFVMPKPADNEGLHAFRLDDETGALIPVASYVPSLNVGNFAYNRQRKVLYVIDEVASSAEFRDAHGSPSGGGGRVYAFSVNISTGQLTELGHWPSFGTQPAGLELAGSDNSYLIVSHFTSRAVTTVVSGDQTTGFSLEPRYDDATTVLFSLDTDGRLGNNGAPVDVHVHSNHRTKRPACLHSVRGSPNGAFFVECDMSRDQLITLSVKEDTAGPALSIQEVRDTPDHSGPRYSAFHPTLPIFYVNYEYSPIIETFSYTNGTTDSIAPSISYKSIGTVAVLPPELPGLDKQPDVLLSDLTVHPSGKFVYTLVRGHNVVSAFAVEATTGTLQRIQTEQLNGNSPKGCTVSANGRWLYVALSQSSVVEVWRVNDDGRLKSTGQTTTVPRPSAMLALEL